MLQKNKELFITGDVKASSEYIFDNQKEDATIILLIKQVLLILHLKRLVLKELVIYKNLQLYL